MKKTSLFLATLLVGMVVLFNSCDEDVTSTAVTVDESKTAELKIYLRADIDSTVTETYAPDGVVVNASVKYNDLNYNFTGSERVRLSATSSGGVVEFTVPTTDDGVTVYVESNDFEYDYINSGDSTLDRRLYYLEDLEYTTYTGGSYVEVEEYGIVTVEDDVTIEVSN